MKRFATVIVFGGVLWLALWKYWQYLDRVSRHGGATPLSGAPIGLIIFAAGIGLLALIGAIAGRDES
jgi:hypothetical protein